MKKIYASALLVDNKIMFWKISGNPKREVWDFNKEFYYADENPQDYIDKGNVRVAITEFVETEDNNHEIFCVLAPKWFSQFELHENYKGSSPFEIEDISRLVIDIPEPKFTERVIYKGN